MLLVRLLQIILSIVLVCQNIKNNKKECAIMCISKSGLLILSLTYKGQQE